MRAPLLFLALLSVACTEQEGPVTSAAVPSLEIAAARLPERVEGFARGDTTWHERTHPGLGVAVDYAGPARAAVATVSLYDRGRPVDPASLEAEFNQALGEVMAAAGARTRQVMTERERRDVAMPSGEPMQCARLAGTYGRQEMTTLVCIGPAAGRFVKVQVTSPTRQVRPVDPMPFVIGVAQAAREG